MYNIFNSLNSNRTELFFFIFKSKSPAIYSMLHLSTLKPSAYGLE